MNRAIEIYDTKEAVREYSKRTKLKLPEQIIQKEVRNIFRGSMLDIGIGTGRTIPFFAPLFTEYIGIDIAPAMVDYCNEKYNDLPNAKIVLGDITEIILGANRFDFVFYPDQGIGFITSIEKMKDFLNKIYRSLRPEGIFAFSIHSANGIGINYKFHLPKNPLNIIPEIKRLRQFKKINGELSTHTGKDFVIMNGDTLCTKPSFQMELLFELGFKNIGVLDKKGKTLVPDLNNLDRCNDNTIHYICKKK